MITLGLEQTLTGYEVRSTRKTRATESIELMTSGDDNSKGSTAGKPAFRSITIVPPKPSADWIREDTRRALKGIEGQMLTLQGRMKLAEAELADMGASMSKLTADFTGMVAALDR